MALIRGKQTTELLRLDQTSQLDPGVDIDFNTGQALNLGAPVNPTDAVRLVDLQNSQQGLSWKNRVRAAETTSNITLSGPQTVDGVLLSAGERALLTAQTTASENGIWEVQIGAWTRPTDFPSGGDAANAAVFAAEGTANADTAYVCTDDPGSDVIDTDPLTFVEFASTNPLVAGAGLVESPANTFNVVANADGSIVVNANDVQVGVLATDAQHGNRGGGALHAVAAPATAGFVGGLPASAAAGAAATFDATGKILGESNAIFPSSASTTLNYPGSDGANGDVLTTDGAGNLTLQPPAAVTVPDPTAGNKDQTPAVTSGNDSNTTLALAATPFSGGTYVKVEVNGVGYTVGNGVSSEDCYFADPGTPTVPKSFGTLASGDVFVWNGVNAAFDLDGTDRVDFFYEV